MPQAKSIPSVLTNIGHGVWVPAFAGTTARGCDEITPRLQPYRHLGVRPRQHAVSASRQSVAAGRCADRRIHRQFPEDLGGGSAAHPEGLLSPLRHQHARHDDRARRQRRRLSRLCAQDRSFAAGAQSGDGGCDRKTAGAQADPDQRLDRPCRRGAGAARHRRPFRGGVRHHRRRAGAEAGAADLPEVPQASRRRSLARGDVRGSRPQPRGAAPARHDHGAGGARRHQGSGARGLGAGRPRRRLCRSCHG